MKRWAIVPSREQHLSQSLYLYAQIWLRCLLWMTPQVWLRRLQWTTPYFQAKINPLSNHLLRLRPLPLHQHLELVSLHVIIIIIIIFLSARVRVFGPLTYFAISCYFRRTSGYFFYCYQPRSCWAYVNYHSQCFFRARARGNSGRSCHGRKLFSWC